ncbi:MAG: rod shape-determining protein MreC [Pseudomonadota bacterium]|jgi:rod shape-determining protein MreC
MSLGTLNQAPPPFFRQGFSAVSKLAVFSALSVFLMVADVRLKITEPLRSTLATVMYPLQSLVIQPLHAVQVVGQYVTALHASQTALQAAQQQLLAQSAQANQVASLLHENARLRTLLEVRARAGLEALAADVLYDAADPFSRKVVISRGQLHGVQAGMAVIDAAGVLGQVTRVYPMVSEVHLLTDRDQAIPVLNLRTGARYLAYGRSGSGQSSMELRFTPNSADLKVGDALVTSGVDGVYPPGLAVGQVRMVDQRSNSAFANIVVDPVANTQGALQVLVLTRLGEALPPSPLLTPSATEHSPTPRSVP